MVTDEKPRVNSLQPHIRSQLRKSVPPNRPSMMAAIEYEINFVEQNKNTRKGSKVAAANR